MARRGHNEGSIYKRADGRWEARVTVESDASRAYGGRPGRPLPAVVPTRAGTQAPKQSNETTRGEG